MEKGTEKRGKRKRITSKKENKNSLPRSWTPFEDFGCKTNLSGSPRPQLNSNIPFFPFFFPVTYRGLFSLNFSEKTHWAGP